MTATTTLQHAGYTAEIDAVGAGLRALRHGERDLVFRVDGPVPTPPFAGLALAPWPNRISGGRYTFDGAEHQLPVNEVDLGNALHGLVLWERWATTEVAPGSVTLAHTISPRPGYPFTIELSARYALDDDGLTFSMHATNAGATAAPVGLSTHPYFTTGDGTVLDDWRLQLPCSEVVETDARLRPTRTVPVAGAGLDFTRGRPIGSAVIDHAFTAIPMDGNGFASARLTGVDGRGIDITWDAACRWLQVYTLHAPGHAMHRRAVALEPMTCAPDAFNSGAGLVRLAPGEATAMWCRIAVR